MRVSYMIFIVYTNKLINFLDKGYKVRIFSILMKNTDITFSR